MGFVVSIRSPASRLSSRASSLPANDGPSDSTWLTHSRATESSREQEDGEEEEERRRGTRCVSLPLIKGRASEGCISHRSLDPPIFLDGTTYTCTCDSSSRTRHEAGTPVCPVVRPFDRFSRSFRYMQSLSAADERRWSADRFAACFRYCSKEGGFSCQSSLTRGSPPSFRGPRTLVPAEDTFISAPDLFPASEVGE